MTAQGHNAFSIPDLIERCEELERRDEIEQKLNLSKATHILEEGIREKVRRRVRYLRNERKVAA